MAEKHEPQGTEEKNLIRILSAAIAPAAPPLAAGIPAQLAARARTRSSNGIGLPIAAAGCCVAGLVLLALLPLLPAGRMDLRWWVAAVPAVNLLLGPFAAAVIIRKMPREAIDAKI